MMGYPKKGEIYLVNFDPTIGHEAKKKRPALIISNNIHNQYSPLVTVAPLSSNITKVYPFEVYVSKKSTGLNENSKIMIIQLRSVDQKRLINKIGNIEDNKIINQINKVISEHFDL
ncbi:MAG: mRNA interferase [Parcubacteria bacterium 34_609]|nr:MAG: mRNA interferase [Parcubacteria bacterium 34_609]MBP8718462.1 type II toxin-antitoxin system PemK/MazF family toxin [Candidatus Atribacteria bacterium]